MEVVVDLIEIGIVLSGIITIGVSLFHIPPVWERFFPKWKEETGRMSLLHRKLISTVLLALALMLLVFAFASIFFAREIAVGNSLGVGLAIAFSIFWLWRAAWQVFYFPPSKIEHDTKLLVLHYSLIAICLGNSAIYGILVFSRW